MKMRENGSQGEPAQLETCVCSRNSDSAERMLGESPEKSIETQIQSTCALSLLSTPLGPLQCDVRIEA
jgi:hypothetical protein